MEVTTVAAQGEAEGKFNLATFSINLISLAATVVAAKDQLSAAIVELKEALDSAKTNLGFEFVKNSVKSTSSVDSRREWQNNTQVLVGFQAVYSFSFEVSDLDKVSKIYDALTSLSTSSDKEGITLSVATPAFNLKRGARERLNKKALEQAFAFVIERFASECQVLALNPADFEVANWTVSYSDSRRSPRMPVIRAATVGSSRMSATGGVSEAMAQGDDIIGDSKPSIEFNTGLATVSVNLEVAFQRKLNFTSSV